MLRGNGWGSAYGKQKYLPVRALFVRARAGEYGLHFCFNERLVHSPTKGLEISFLDAVTSGCYRIGNLRH